MAKLTHLDRKGRARMVDVGAKEHTRREATARGSVLMQKATVKLINEGRLPKGDVLAIARVAGIMAAKKTPDIIPLCHPVPLSSVTVDMKTVPSQGRVDISATAACTGQTGVEMEALTAVNAAALAIYDMCKAVDKEMVITNIYLLEKKGGRSGHYKRKQ